MEEAGLIMDDIDIDMNNEKEIEEETLDDFGYERMERYSLQDLEELLHDAIEQEDYMAASILRDEIKKRKGI